MDADLRALERAAATGDEAAQARLALERYRRATFKPCTDPQQIADLPRGTWVRSKAGDPPVGLMVHPTNMHARRKDAGGVVVGWVAGHGGDVWWVQHETGPWAPYVYNELEIQE